MGNLSVHFAVHLLNQHKKYIEVHISTSGHPGYNYKEIFFIMCSLAFFKISHSINMNLLYRNESFSAGIANHRFLYDKNFLNYGGETVCMVFTMADNQGIATFVQRGEGICFLGTFSGEYVF